MPPIDLGMYRALEAVFRRIAQTTPPPAVDTSIETRASSAQKQFRRMDPPIFSGEGEAILAEEWIDALEQIYDSIGMIDDDLRMATAPLYLRSRAAKWWKGEQRLIVTGATGPITWEQFRTRFLDEFFPISLQDRKRAEFTNLIQGTSSVQEYHRRFTELSQYAPELVANERHRCRRFEEGLKPSIPNFVAAVSYVTYKGCYEGAL
ncbi:retrotransposon gag domain-containing protein, partial [Klebsiella pneumoniae]|uniref:retrotransposon gag family protein n=1 Tax=Klebsiella pneumoniae TaxID=573 RepID=UPI0019394B06